MADRTRYSQVAMWLHWIIAFLLVGNILLGYWFAWIEDTQHTAAAANPQGIEVFLRHWTRTELLAIHKPIGFIVLGLSIIRLGWRLVNPPPPFLSTQQPWEKALATVVHWSFYAVMIGFPLVGWAMLSASPRYASHPFVFFGIPIPGFPGVPTTPHNATHDLLKTIHTDWAPWLFWAVLTIHVLAALKHQFVDRDGELGRMIPFLREPGRA
jgi:cytochrome b561